MFRSQTPPKSNVVDDARLKLDSGHTKVSSGHAFQLGKSDALTFL